ncbi:hypothetical protein L6452_43862 [Arctium lappa]|uniref:Uncharacterized protein n=1 Tax=Arctium lappa TaxID=4217 RepID=A0ACB8XEL9_ARCLA|nr:hypothetical protein L6452_43862 [Arctium lappa]
MAAIPSSSKNTDPHRPSSSPDLSFNDLATLKNRWGFLLKNRLVSSSSSLRFHHCLLAFKVLGSEERFGSVKILCERSEERFQLNDLKSNSNRPLEAKRQGSSHCQIVLPIPKPWRPKGSDENEEIRKKRRVDFSTLPNCSSTGWRLVQGLRSGEDDGRWSVAISLYRRHIGVFFG